MLKKFSKDYPVGYKFKWWDHDTWHIVGYLKDTIFKKNEYVNLVTMKSWNKYKQRWRYETKTIYSLYDSLMYMKKEKEK